MMKNFYLVLTLLGLIIPNLVFFSFYAEHGMDIPLIIDQLFVNKISSFFALDLLISAIAALSFMIYQGIKIKMKLFWIPVACTILIGLSFGFPLYLYLREVHLKVE